MIHTPAVRQPYAFPNHKPRSRRSQVLGLLALACAILTTVASTATAQAAAPSQVAAGIQHSCAVLSDGTVNCWGSNFSGQLGDGSTTDSTSPVIVDGITIATQVSAGADHSCALLSGGTVKCWGNNGDGQLGDGTTTNSSSPVSVSGITNATQISAGYQHSCALLTGGTVKCWGYNGYGQLGDGTPTDSSSPVSVTGITTATQVSASETHTCALLSDGTVKCWGANDDGELGDGTVTSSNSPVSAGPLSADTNTWLSALSGVVKPSNSMSPYLDQGLVSGAPKRDTKLHTSFGSWGGYIGGSSTVSFQWQRCTTSDSSSCTTNIGTNGQWYKPVADDVGSYLMVTATLTTNGQTATASTTVSGQVANNLLGRRAHAAVQHKAKTHKPKRHKHKAHKLTRHGR